MLFMIIGVFILLIALILHKRLDAKKIRSILAICLVVLMVGTLVTVLFENYFNNTYLKVSGYVCTDENNFPVCKFVNLYTNVETQKYYIVKENILGIKSFCEVEPLNDGEFYVVGEGDEIPMTQYGPAYKIKD